MINEKITPKKARPAIGKIGGLPIPSAEILEYAVEHEILAQPGNAQHVVTMLVIESVLCDAIEKANLKKPPEERFDVDRNLIYELTVANHTMRGSAYQGARAEGRQSLNRYMKNHDDIELAALYARVDHLPLEVQLEMKKTEAKKGFPRNTIGPASELAPSTIDWNAALVQIASFAHSETIQPIDRRFDDLIRRRTRPDVPGKLTREALLSYKDWANARIADICRHIGIKPEDYLSFLREKLFEGIPDAKAKSDALIKELFPERPLLDDEFLPVSPAYTYIAKAIIGMDDSGRKRQIEHMLSSPKEFLRLSKTFGLI